MVDDADRPVPTGEAGEILVPGRQVMDRLLGRARGHRRRRWPAAGCTPATSVGSTPTGYLSVVDRTKDVIVTGGENVSSLEVEEVIHTRARGRPGRGRSGVPDPRWGENVCAVVVARAGDDGRPRRAGRARPAPSSAGFKVPRHVVVIDALPNNATGKVVKAELRAWLHRAPRAPGERR